MVSGRKPIFNDEWHKKMRERQRDYMKRNREAWNLAAREHISIAEARKILGITNPNLKTRWGKRKKPEPKEKKK